ncbi:ATP-dependent DNA helicase [Jonesia denitrificans]|uniref:DNA 3'-5' helicase n=1 Tax=Jonesia denitrificans (strain ATCC 14870 / DSM 20603 / BCRC 15368 / CIP 55.134 / JCM 11481 / NBRC 15587 / NCTC 10816 / Prevot 55134) TaxID=471856 RepID=C7R1Q8_JONDD|nr:ATP-dependent DNA helicase [Jonesia denitrificans]ACV08376.1 UvrD/REP helicase [Jonesia denitrificans DSM 20603]ASE07970.1 ATP-dependent helicase [Jonesia denitrificans]QXB42576.1 ATP-dependent helicase [Jonesia denitrificans]SQH20356.1 ATP-dependent DNA helicase pcrA [Jonesia denitrificans]
MTRLPLSARDIAQLLDLPHPTVEQQAIIEAPLESMLVIAGAGSGKTETMSARVVWLIANQIIAPERVLGLTFTRKAAGELTERIRARLAHLDRVAPGLTSRRIDTNNDRHTTADTPPALSALARPTISTYNSYAASLVTEHGLRIGREPGARLLTEASIWAMVSDIVDHWQEDLDTDYAVSTMTDAVVTLAGELADHLLTVPEAATQLDHLLESLADLPLAGRSLAPSVAKLGKQLATKRRLLDLVSEYHRVKRHSESMDFSDQVVLAAELARDHPFVADTERRRFAVVLLDEYQDTSYAQIQLLTALFGDGHPVTAVGDPNQSIYGWRGASASGLTRFPRDFPRPNGTPASIASLSTSWRNDAQILSAAHRIALPLASASALPLPTLSTRPGAGTGSVTVGYYLSAQDEAQGIADFFTRHFVPGMTTAAVLCRARKQFPLLEETLRNAGLPVEVVGLGGLLHTPEIRDLVSMLEVVHDPSRGDSLMRLLTGPRFHLGAHDIHTLGVWARELSSRAHGYSGPPRGALREAADERSIVDALAQLPPRSWQGHHGETFSEAGYERLTQLSALIDALRQQTYLALPEFVDATERALGLDVEVALRAAHRHAETGTTDPSDPWGRAHLDAFRSVVTDFVHQAVHPTLGALLAWLDDARDRERGLDRPTGHLDPHAIHLITVHAAKGLEWDLVAVPALSDGVFPSTATTTPRGPTDSGWTSHLGALPFSLRGDAPDLPHLSLADADHDAEIARRLTEFTAQCGHYQVAEERRLAYVAYTRARTALLVTGAWWRTGKTATPPSPFLTELLDIDGVQIADLVTEPGDDNPHPPDGDTAVWPQSLVDDITKRAADLVMSTRHNGRPILDHIGPVQVHGVDLAQRARQVLNVQQRPRGSSVIFPDHVSVSGLVELSADREGFLTQYQRPIPRQPSPQSRRGTTFHLWVEQFYGHTPLFDMDDLDNTSDSDDHGTDRTLDELKATFEQSRWARLTPKELEADIDVVIAGVVIRARIDAVFDDPDRPGGVIVVDWKTGRAPTTDADQRHRNVQLAVYRLAWATWSGCDINDVTAAFYYVAQDLTVIPDQLPEREELERLVRHAGNIQGVGPQDH